jgi:hypothetical protein
VIHIVMYRTKTTRQWRWRAVNPGNNRKMANSGEGYWNRGDCVSAIRALFGPGTVLYLRSPDHSEPILLRDGRTEK